MAQRSESVRVLEGGRIVIPARIRKELGIKAGDSLSLEVEDGVLRLETPVQRIKRAQAMLAPYLKGPSLADELIAERRADSAADG
ncbi:MAG: AbrB/MazE/SpoVT family DNA-binding domain-containing protein [Dehalococcoidia bacterium]|nr:AbrB/MazE/SpoVT family DNA-binding domain-containing protein [Dehalococcoidia bacterium]